MAARPACRAMVSVVETDCSDRLEVSEGVSVVLNNHNSTNVKLNIQYLPKYKVGDYMSYRSSRTGTNMAETLKHPQCEWSVMSCSGIRPPPENICFFAECRLMDIQCTSLVLVSSVKHLDQRDFTEIGHISEYHALPKSLKIVTFFLGSCFEGVSCRRAPPSQSRDSVQWQRGCKQRMRAVCPLSSDDGVRQSRSMCDANAKPPYVRTAQLPAAPDTKSISSPKPAGTQASIRFDEAENVVGN